MTNSINYFKPSIQNRTDPLVCGAFNATLNKPQSIREKGSLMTLFDQHELMYPSSPPHMLNKVTISHWLKLTTIDLFGENHTGKLTNTNQSISL